MKIINGKKSGVVVKNNVLRKSGLEIIGEVPWGTHFCQFYQSKEDLIEILVPYFKQGLENNEFCMWVTSEPLGAEDVKKALKEKVKNLDEYIKKGQIEILDYSQWYTKTGRFDADKVLEGWVKKEEQAIERGFDGLRLTGNTFWLEKESWESFTNYEAIVNSVIGKHRMLAVCSYSLDKCQASEIVDVVSNHQFAIIKKESKWVSLESSERKQAEGALQKSVQLLEDTGEMAKVGGWELDLSTKAVSWTEEVGRIHGVEPGYKPKLEEALSFYPPESRPDVEAAVKKAAETGEPYDLESLFIPSGSKDKIWVRSLGRAVYSGGKIVKLAGTFQNIDKYKKAEEALRASEIKHRTLLENLPQKIFLKDENLVYISCNENYARDLKIRPEEIAGKTDYDFYPKELAEKYRADDKRIMDSGKTEEIEEKYIQDQEEIFVYASKTPIKDAQRNVVGILGIFWDITERKQAEENLKSSEGKYRSLVQNIPDVVWTTDINGKTIFISPNVKEIYGYTSEEIYKGGDSIWFDRIHPDDAEKVKGAFISLFEKGRLFDAEYRIQRKNKDWIWLHDRAINVYEKNGIKYADGVFLDITERKQAEVTVVEEKNKLEKYLSVIGAIVVLFDQGGKVLFINKNGCEILGHEIKDILNKDWFTNFVLEKDRTRATAVFEGLIKEKSDKTKYFKTHVLTKSGKQIAISWGSVVEKDEAGEIRTVLNTGIDITQLEDAKITINQLEELNKLKDDFLNIATHELKTPLTSIIGLSEVMNGQSQALNPESQKYINIINAEGHKLNHIIKRILRVTRFESDREIIFNEKINLKKVIFSFLPSLEVMANKKDVKIVIDIKDKNINLISDKEKISEVIYNLVDNAIKYGPGNQPITIAIHKPKKELVKIEVKDRGPGISPESQKKIFDKFVQLEPFLIRSRDGTGLGLYICKLIVNSLGGKIGVKSVLGKGSNFFFTLPIQKDIKS